ncbi:MAG: ABC transporter ATP-binding protein [Chloroflexi bacterium]|nr:ABC transporter ATP-binding protein [Chloroflexota bacterium]
MPTVSGVSVSIVDARVRLGNTLVLDGLSLEVAAGECVALLGSSGSGKTTILRLLGGLVPAERGAIFADGREIGKLPPERRGMAMIHQRFLLFPHLTAGENVAFGLPYRGVPRGEHGQRVADLLRLVGLEGLAGRYPHELSGGQQQRVAIARALATRPRVLLLDEPLNSLDQPIRERLLDELRALHRAEGWTMLYVTHDQAEAARIAAQVAVLEGGRILQIAPYETLREQPASEAVARVLGLRNLTPAVLRDGSLHLTDLDVRAAWDGPAPATAASPLLAYLPPDRLTPGPGGPGCLRVDGTVDEVASLPHAVLVQVRRGSGRLQAIVTRSTLAAAGIVVGGPLTLSIEAGSVHLLAEQRDEQTVPTGDSRSLPLTQRL